MMEIDPTKTIVSMGGTIPEPLADAQFSCEGVTYKGGYDFHRQFFTLTEGLDLEYLVWEWTWHPMMPDCRVGWLSGPFTRTELKNRHPEYKPLRAAELERRLEIAQTRPHKEWHKRVKNQEEES